MSAKPYVGNTSPLPAVSNADVIEALVQGVPPGATPVVCTKTGDPTEGGWSASPAKDCELSPASNNYVNCSTFRLAADGTVAARTEDFAGYHFVLLDDVGTKVEPERLQGLEPTAIVETSPGNFQWLIALDKPITDYDEAKRLQKAVAAKGLTDPGASGPNRWARLPFGTNGKPKHLKDGQPFQCRLTKFNPGQRYSVEQLVDVLGLELAAPAVHTPVSTPATADPAELNRLVYALDPSMGREHWIRVLMAVWHETGGSEEGFQLIDGWSSGGTNYKGTEDVRVQWKSFHTVERPITKASLWAMARDHPELCAQKFERCEFTVEETPASEPEAQPNPFDKYDITGDPDEFIVPPAPLLGQVLLHGEFGVVYGKPGTGKTLIVLRLVCDAIEEGRVDPKKVYYFNMDDSSSGIAEKKHIAREAGFKMIAADIKNSRRRISTATSRRWRTGALHRARFSSLTRCLNSSA